MPTVTANISHLLPYPRLSLFQLTAAQFREQLLPTPVLFLDVLLFARSDVRLLRTDSNSLAVKQSVQPRLRAFLIRAAFLRVPFAEIVE